MPRRALEKDGITKAEAVRRFKRSSGFSPDPEQRREAWGNFTHALWQQGLITREQREGWTFPWGTMFTQARPGGARPGAGRPPTLKDPERINVRVDAATIAWLDRLARSHDLTRGEAVRRMLACIERGLGFGISEEDLLAPVDE